MTEAEWLAAEDPVPMLAFLNPALALPGVSLASPRKLRLFACACAALLPQRRPAQARSVEAALAFADDGIGPRGLETARWDNGAWSVCHPDAGEAAYYAVRDDSLTGRRAEMAALLRDVFGNPFRPAPLRWPAGQPECHAGSAQHGFHPPTAYYDPCRWLTPAVLRLARGAYAGGDFAALPVLADALEEAGCGEETLLMHLRGWERCTSCERGWAGEYAHNRCEWCHRLPGWVPLPCPHTRGCFALDLVLGKT